MNLPRKLILLSLITIATPSLAQKDPMTDIAKTPVADTRPYSFTRHGVTIEDPYHWLRDAGYPKVDDKDVLAHLEAENAYFEAQMKPRTALVDSIFTEMKGRIKEDESSVPQKDGDYLYWRKFEKGAQYKQWMRKPVAGGPDEVILDETEMAKGHDYFSLGGIAISDDDKMMAYATDTDGAERYTVRFRELATGKELPDVIEGTLGGFAQPLRPVDGFFRSVGRNGILPGAFGGVAMVRHADHVDFAERAAGDQFLGLGGECGRLCLAANLQHPAGVFGGGDDARAFLQRPRHGLFDVDVFAGREGVKDDLLVPVVRRGDDDGVNVFVIEYGAIVANGLDAIAELFFGALQAAVVEIGDGNSFGSRDGQELINQLFAANAAADESEADSIP